MGNAIYLQAAGVNESGFSFRFGLYCELFFNICGDYTQGNKSGNKHLMVRLSVFGFSNLVKKHQYCMTCLKKLGGNYICSVNNKTFSVMQHGFNKAHLSWKLKKRHRNNKISASKNFT